MKKLKVFIADDHPVFLKGLEEVLKEEETFDVIGSEKSGTQALEKIMEMNPHVAILDIDMPGLNGIEIAKIILEKIPAMKVLILSMHKEYDVVKTALAYGIHGYVFKDDAVIELVQAVKEIVSGKRYVSGGKQPEDYFILEDTEEKLPSIATLTKTERIVLKFIANNRTSREIAEEMNISLKTIENHRFNIARKLGLKGSNSLLKFAIKNIELL